MDKQNDEYKFNDSEAKRIMIPQSTTYVELVENVYQIIDIDTLEFEIIIKFKLKTPDLMLPITIKIKDDVEFFLKK